MQDAHAIRCAPQVLGPARDTLEFVRGIVEREINAASDSPLLFDGQGTVILTLESAITASLPTSLPTPAARPTLYIVFVSGAANCATATSS